MLRFFSILVLLFSSYVHAQSMTGKWRTPVHIGSSGYEFNTGDSVTYNVTDDLFRFSLYGTYVREGSKISIRYFPLIDVRELHLLENEALTLKLTDQKTGNVALKRLVKVVYETDSSLEMFSDANGILIIPDRAHIKKVVFTNHWNETNYELNSSAYKSNYLWVRINFAGNYVKNPDAQHVLILENENVLKRYTNSNYCFSYYRGGFRLPYVRVNEKQEMSFDADTYGNKYVLFAQKNFRFSIPLDTFSTHEDSITIENYPLPLSSGKNLFYMQVIPRDTCNHFAAMIRFEVNCKTRGAKRVSRKSETVIRLSQPTHFYLFSDNDVFLLKRYDDAFDLAAITENGFYTLLFENEKIILEKNSSGIYSDKKKIVTQ